MTDEVTGAPAPEAGTEGAPQEPVQGTPAARPDNVPEQFWDAEAGAINTDALLQYHIDTEAARVAAEEAAASQAQSQEEQAAAAQQARQSEFVSLSEKATAELAENGAVTDETYTAFAATGVTREQVDTFVEGQIARAELRQIHCEREAGGEEAYAALLAWAGANYTPEDAEAYNDTVHGPNKEAALAAVRTLKQRYEDTMGTEGKIVTDGTGGAAPGGYANKSEWLADMRKPEYKNDSGFRDGVRRKLEVALKNGVNMGVSTSAG